MTKAIEAQHQAVTAAFNALQGKIDDMTPVMAALAEDMTERIKQRFRTTTGPDDVRWPSNAVSTVMNYLQKRGGFSKKTGKITAKGQALAMNKKPLQGESGDLARQIYPDASSHELSVGSTMIYAAMQHFGGKKSEFPRLWGDIPARPFFPITAAGELYQSEADEIVAHIQQYLIGS